MKCHLLNNGAVISANVIGRKLFVKRAEFRPPHDFWQRFAYTIL